MDKINSNLSKTNNDSMKKTNSTHQDKSDLIKRRPYLYDALAFQEKTSDKQQAEEKEQRKGRYTVAAMSLIRQKDIYDKSKKNNFNTDKTDFPTTLLSREKRNKNSYYDESRGEFSTRYYKNGKLCYFGCISNEKREGPGVVFSAQDQSLTVSSWKNDESTGIFSQFDEQARLTFCGNLVNKQKSGMKFFYDDNNHIFIYGNIPGKACEFDEKGNLVYSGYLENNIKNGFGTQFDEHGQIVYSGNFKENKYHGEGILYSQDGFVYEAEFKCGVLNGFGTQYDENGHKIYEGYFVDGAYHGKGCKFLLNGSYYEGEFEEKQTEGEMLFYDKNKSLIYKGQIDDDKFSGTGTYYFDGKKVYEGGFKENQFHGYGKEYQDDSCIYEGEFKNNTRCGIGTSFKGKEITYVGMWKNDSYDGYGVLYSEGKPKFAGEFSCGKMNGRINKMQDGIVVDECIYCNNKVTYMRKFELDRKNNLSLIYEGYIEHNLPNGSGCTFDEYGEIKKEGFFEDGEFKYALQLSKHKYITPIPKVKELQNTDYTKFLKGANYCIEKDFGMFTYTGMLQNNRPHGKCTLRFDDHKFKGELEEGKPCGYGIITKDSTVVAKGNFLAEKSANCKVIKMNAVNYFLDMDV